MSTLFFVTSQMEMFNAFTACFSEMVLCSGCSGGSSNNSTTYI